MTIDCGACNDFVAYALSHFSAFLARHDFQFIECATAHDGRECSVMYQSARCRLLLTLSDGAYDCSLATLDTPFPGTVAFYLNGEAGWYSVLFLIEYKLGKKLLTRRQIEKIWRGELDKFAWIASLLDDWSDTLVNMFAAGKPLAWHNDFARFIDAR